MAEKKKPQKYDVDETAGHGPDEPGTGAQNEPEQPPPLPPGGGTGGEDGGYPDPKTPDPDNPPKE